MKKRIPYGIGDFRKSLLVSILEAYYDIEREKNRIRNF
jgi:hypothetical protein